MKHFQIVLCNIHLFLIGYAIYLYLFPAIRYASDNSSSNTICLEIFDEYANKTINIKTESNLNMLNYASCFSLSKK